jgi:predicted dehydrogenase
MDEKRNSRRDFIKLAAATGVVAGASKSVLGTGRHFLIEYEQDQTPVRSPNDQIQIALIGAGGQGTSDTETALKVPGVKLVAVSDVYDGRLVRAKERWGNEIFTTRDYREVLARPDVDAVIIATPDHWHQQITVDAVAAGKDVYCEKPMVQVVDEGMKVVEAQRKSNRIIQVGSQRVSSIVYRKAKELLASGAIGELNMIESWLDRNSAIGAWQYTIPPDASPQNIDWDRFLGRAPKRPFEPIRLFRWRNYRDYGTGVAGDLFVHLFSGVHYVLGSNGPVRVMATGGLRFWNDGRDVPDVMFGLYDYPKTAAHPAFNMALRVNFACGAGETAGFRFIGSEGVLTLDSSVTLSRKPREKEPGYTIDTFPKALQEQFLKEYRAKYPPRPGEVNESKSETYSAPPGYRDHYDHLANFFASIRARKTPVEDAVFGLRAAGPALLSNDSYFNNRIYEWDPEAMKVINSKESVSRSQKA